MIEPQDLIWDFSLYPITQMYSEYFEYKVIKESEL